MAFSGIGGGQVADDDPGPVIAQVGLDNAEASKHVDTSLVRYTHDGVMPEVSGVVEVSYLHGKLVPKLVARLLMKSDARHAQYLHQIHPAGQER